MSAAAIAFDEGIEQDGRGVTILIAEFYQIETGAHTRRAQERQPAALGGARAVLRALVAVELQQRQRHPFGHVGDLLGVGIDEQADHRDEGAGGLGQRGGAGHIDVAGAAGIEHQPDRVGAGIDGRAHILLASQPADLDAGARADRHELRLGAGHASWRRHRQTLHETGCRPDRRPGCHRAQDT